MGIDVPIVPRGNSPPSDNSSVLEPCTNPWSAFRGSHESYEEHRDAADEILREELKLGRLDWAATAADLTDKYGEIVRSQVAMAERADGFCCRVDWRPIQAVAFTYGSERGPCHHTRGEKSDNPR